MSLMKRLLSSRGVPAPSSWRRIRLRLNAPTWISWRFRMFSCPRRWQRRIPFQRDGRNSECGWPGEASNHAVGARHLSADAECTEDLAILYADRSLDFLILAAVFEKNAVGLLGWKVASIRLSLL